MHFIIYKTTHVQSGKYYIGMHSTSDLEDGYLGSGKWIKAAVKKHGRDSFERVILKELSSYDDMKNEEAKVINEEVLNDPLCMNMMHGGKGGWKTLNDSDSAYQRRSEAGKKAHEVHKHLVNNLQRGSNQKTVSTLKEKYGNDHFAKLGKMKNVTDEYRSKLSKAQCGMKMINNGKINTFVKKEELNEYLSKGWVLGRIRSQ
jgi:hypothetical protein